MLDNLRLPDILLTVMTPSSRGLGRQPLKLETGIRFPLGSLENVPSSIRRDVFLVGGAGVSEEFDLNAVRKSLTS